MRFHGRAFSGNPNAGYRRASSMWTQPGGFVQTGERQRQSGDRDALPSHVETVDAHWRCRFVRLGQLRRRCESFANVA